MQASGWHIARVDDVIFNAGHCVAS